MSDFYIVLVYLTLLGAGLVAPFALTIGYVWVDLSYPQYLSTYFTGQPVAMVMGGAAVIAYFLADRRSPPRANLVTILTVSMAVWVTLTCYWAVAPSDVVWGKWSWAFKTVLFSAFIPYAIRSRSEIEAFLQVFVFSIAIHIIPGALKTILGGGGYSRAFGVIRSNIGLLESSTVAAVAIMIIPILLSLKRHSILLPKCRLRSVIYVGYVLLSAIAAVGTFARTGLIGFGILAVGAFLQARQKAAVLIVIVAGTLAAAYLGPGAWQERMETIDTYTQDSSAMARILVWEWTFNFAAKHPFGGGFNSYYLSEIMLPSESAMVSQQSTITGKAFHNAYIEVLGEHGWVGLMIFIGILFLAFRNLRRVRAEARLLAELAWCYDLSGALLVSLFVLAVCANFVGIAFQPLFWYLFAVSVCLREHVFRYKHVQSATAEDLKKFPFASGDVMAASGSRHLP